MINQCIIGKTSGFDRPSSAKKGKKTKPHFIPYCWFTKLIICYLGRTHNIHQRYGSPFHIAEEDPRLGNLKSVLKGEDDETTSTSKADQSKKPTTAKQSKPVSSKQSKPPPVIKPKVAQEKASQPSPLMNVHKGKVLKKVQKGKSPLKLVDEDEEIQHEPEPQDEGKDDDFNRAFRMSLDSFQAESQVPVGGVAVREPVPEITRKLPEVEGKVALEEKTAELDEGQTGLDPSRIPESGPLPDVEKMEEDQARLDPGKSLVALAGPNHVPMHEDFMDTIYPNVYESLKLPADGYVILEDQLSSSRTLSLMKNLDDMYTFGDQFFNDKSTEDEPGKPNVEAEVVSMTHSEHAELYEALDRSMARDNIDEFLVEKAKSQKRRHDDQDPPQPPPKDSNHSKKKKHDTDVSASRKHPTQTPFAWKTNDTRDTPSRSFKQKQASPYIKTPATWLRPLPEEDIPETPKLDWSVPPNDLPKPENNWANALAKTYKDPEENKLLWKTGKKKLNKYDLEGPVFMVDLVNPKGHRIVPDVSKPLPLGGPPGQELYINRHGALSDHRTVRSHMQILIVISLKTYERYGYTYLREIVIGIADYNEYKISKADFKNLYSNDFEDLYLLHL
nr:hypothetical protein [Tanacetum cinerariifolium]